MACCSSFRTPTALEPLTASPSYPSTVYVEQNEERHCWHACSSEKDDMHRYQAAPLRSPPPSSRTLPPRSAPPSQTSGSSGRSAPSYDRYPVSTTLQSGSKGSSLGKSDGLYAKDDVPAGQEYNDVYDDDDDYVRVPLRDQACCRCTDKPMHSFRDIRGTRNREHVFFQAVGW